MKKHLDRIGRPIHVGDTVQHRRSRERAIVLQLVGTTRIQVRVGPRDGGRVAVWYASETML